MNTTKICTKCNKRKALCKFHKRSQRKGRSKHGKPYRKNTNNTGKSDYQAICKNCWKIKAHKHYLKNKDKIKVVNALWHKAHREKRRNIARKERLRLLSFFDSKCNRCGFTDERALQIDHINGDGYKDKRSYKSKTYVLLKLMKNNPDLVRQRFQLLCANCNWIKRAENHEHNH